MLYGLAIFIFVLICILLMVIILLQSSKSGGMGGAIMGGGAINTAFGGHGADKLLVRITSGLAAAFMVLAIIIGMMDNPASKIDFDNKPTLTRNTNNVNNIEVSTDPVTPLDIQTDGDDENVDK
tara:strand:+ start:804 stop:1175 length:372 start_codon:yes stop_codon:yes gene_type:complete